VVLGDSARHPTGMLEMSGGVTLQHTTANKKAGANAPAFLFHLSPNSVLALGIDNRECGHIDNIVDLLRFVQDMDWFR